MDAAYVWGVIIGCCLTGGILGAIPAICGAVKGKIKLGLFGFFSCLFAAFLLGLLLTVPVCAIFVYFICKKDKPKTSNESTISEVSVRTKCCSKCGEVVIFDAVYCSKCGFKFE